MRRTTATIAALFVLSAALASAQAGSTGTARGNAAGAPILVSAAASLTDVLTLLKPAAEKAAGVPVQFNFGGSGSLRKQISEGAPVDVFFSAAMEDMDVLDKAGLLSPGTRVNLLSNAIVMVGDAGLPEMKDAASLGKPLADAKVIAIGNPDSVPAGRYAKEALKRLDLYGLVDGKLALGGSVREVLQFVQSGSAPLGFVFLTDAMTLKPGSGVKVLFRFSASAIATPIIYPIAVVKASRNAAAAERYIAFLRGPEAAAAFAAAGFVAP